MFGIGCEGPTFAIFQALKHAAGTFSPLLIFTLLIEFFILGRSRAIARPRSFYAGSTGFAVGGAWIVLMFLALAQIECSTNLGRLATVEWLYFALCAISIVPKWLIFQIGYGIPFLYALGAASVTHVFVFLTAYLLR